MLASFPFKLIRKHLDYQSHEAMQNKYNREMNVTDRWIGRPDIRNVHAAVCIQPSALQMRFLWAQIFIAGED